MREWDRLDAAVFQRQNGGIGAAKGARQGVLRTQSVGSHRLLPELSRQRLEIVLLEVLDSSEETILRSRDSSCITQSRRDEFEGTGNIGNLEKPITGRADFRHKLNLGREDCECLFQNGSDLRLSVVVVDFDLFTRVKVFAMGNQEIK